MAEVLKPGETTPTDSDSGTDIPKLDDDNTSNGPTSSDDHLSSCHSDEAISAQKLESIETEISLARLELNDQAVPEIVIQQTSPIHDLDLDPDRIETVSSHSDSVSCSSSLRSSDNGSVVYPASLGNEDSFDSSVSNSSRNGSPIKLDDEISPAELLPVPASDGDVKDPGEAEEASLMNQQLLQLLADMNKMKRRCKHILDVTDRYCALRPGWCNSNSLFSSIKPFATGSLAVQNGSLVV